MMASCGPLHGKESVWADLTSIRFESSYKLASLDRDELNTLRSVYATMYPKVDRSIICSGYPLQEIQVFVSGW